MPLVLCGWYSGLFITLLPVTCATTFVTSTDISCSNSSHADTQHTNTLSRETPTRETAPSGFGRALSIGGRSIKLIVHIQAVQQHTELLFSWKDGGTAAHFVLIIPTLTLGRLGRARPALVRLPGSWLELMPSSSRGLFSAEVDSGPGTTHEPRAASNARAKLLTMKCVCNRVARYLDWVAPR